MLAKKTYELALCRNYVQAWGVVEAVRELIQNGIDSPAPFEYSFNGSTLRIISRGVRLDASTLVLGRTSKADDDDQIGQFGEGYKLAMLVLAREGKTLSIYNGDKCWSPIFRMSPMFGTETLHILEDEIDQTDALEFAIGDMTEEEQQAVIDSCLFMQPDQTDKIKTSRGEILPSRPGKLYVGGLFICDTEMKYGYNFDPRYIQLERDRKTVNNWDLKIATKDIWFATGQHDKIAQLIHDNIADLSWAEYSSEDVIKEACYRHFQAHYKGKVIAKTQDELNALVKRGMTVYLGGSAYYANVSASSSYKTSYAPPRKIPPHEVLETWLKDNEKSMLPRTIKTFHALIEQSKGWVVS
jgi:hypothetical protein